MNNSLPLSLSESDIDRYSRQLLLDGFSEEAQIKLARTKMLVVGAGGIGAPLLYYLVAAGAKHITVIDHDEVARSNLNRQILHDESWLGKNKADSAKARLESFASDCQINAISEQFTCDNATALVNDCDIILDGSDNIATRYLVSDTAYALKKPLFSSAVRGFTGHVYSFKNNHAKETPCYRCLYPEVDEKADMGCTRTGVLGAVIGVTASMQALQAIKYIAAIVPEEMIFGKFLLFDGLKMRYNKISITKDPACPCCGDQAMDTQTNEA